MRFNIILLLASFLMHGSVFAVERGAPVEIVFTTSVLKINRTTGQMILEYSEGGKRMVKKSGTLLLENYDALERKILIQIEKVHEKKPWIIARVVKGEYKEIERGFKYKTTKYNVESSAKPAPSESKPKPKTEDKETPEQEDGAKPQ